MLPIWVGVFEANAIALQIENIQTPRPMTHDLLRNIIQDLQATVDKIVVCDLKENTFYAMIHLRTPAGPVAIDARPSDAIALALRTRAPILVDEKVIDHAKTVDLSNEKQDSDRLQQWLEQLDPDDMGKYKDVAGNWQFAVGSVRRGNGQQPTVHHKGQFCRPADNSRKSPELHNLA